MLIKINNMKETNVNYELAVALKEIGFDWEVDSVYFAEQPKTVDYLQYYQGSGDGFTKNSTIQDDFFSSTTQPICLAPTLALAQKWFREVHKIYIDIQIEMIVLDTNFYTVSIYNFDTTQEFGIRRSMLITGQISHEKALEKGLIHACKLVKQ